MEGKAENAEHNAENYSLRIKYNSKNKEKILQLLANYKIEAEELNLKYAKNWLFVKQKICEEKISDLEKKLKEFGEGIVVEKVKQYSINQRIDPSSKKLN